MATTSTVLNALDQLLDEYRWGPTLEERLGIKITGATVNAGATFTTTHPELNRLGNDGPTARLQGWHAYVSDDNEERMITTIASSSGTCTVTVSTAFTGQANATVYILRDSYANILAAFNDVLNELYVENMIPLAHGPDDWHMQVSDETSWTETNLHASSGKQTTDAEVWQGARSYRVLGDGANANGYTASSLMRVGQGKQIQAHFIAKADVGTGEPAVFDSAGNEEHAFSITEEDWVYGTKAITIGSTDEGVRWRLRTDGVSDEMDVQFAWFVKLDNLAFRLPENIDRRAKFKGVVKATFHQPSADADCWLADSIEYQTLTHSSPPSTGDDYYTSIRQGDAVPNWLYIRKERASLLQEALFLLVEVPYAASYNVAAALTANTDTFLVPLQMFVAYAKHLIGRRNKAMSPVDFEAQGWTDYKALLRDDKTELPPRQIVVRRMFS